MIKRGWKRYFISYKGYDKDSRLIVEGHIIYKVRKQVRLDVNDVCISCSCKF